jgi:protein-S-isoprenylcysteine O-methyltransferase Ste14
MAWRIRDEENLLTKDLPGYAEYRNRVKDRLLPSVW